MNTDTQVRILLVELAKVKAEATKLRKKLGENGKHARRVERAVEDALLLSMIRIAGVHPSRRLAASVGIHQGRWEHALALLRMARVITRQRHWATTDLVLIESRLKAAKERALQDKSIFFLRHSRHQRGW